MQPLTPHPHSCHPNGFPEAKSHPGLLNPNPDTVSSPGAQLQLHAGVWLFKAAAEVFVRICWKNTKGTEESIHCPFSCAQRFGLTRSCPFRQRLAGQLHRWDFSCEISLVRRDSLQRKALSVCLKASGVGGGGLHDQSASLWLLQKNSNLLLLTSPKTCQKETKNKCRR